MKTILNYEWYVLSSWLKYYNISSLLVFNYLREMTKRRMFYIQFRKLLIKRVLMCIVKTPFYLHEITETIMYYV